MGPIKLLYNSKFDFTAKSLVTKSFIITRVLCIYILYCCYTLQRTFLCFSKTIEVSKESEEFSFSRLHGKVQKMRIGNTCKSLVLRLEFEIRVYPLANQD